VRQPTQELIEALTLFKDSRSAYDEKYKAKHFLLTGGRGTGKTCGLAQVVHHARREGWLCLYVPRAYRLMHSTGWVDPSDHYEGMFSTPHTCQDILQQFLKAHELHLDEVPLVDPECGGRYPKASLKTMLELVELGATDLEFSSHVMVDLRDELAKTKVFPVLIAIDEYDALFRDTSFWFKQVHLKGEQFLTVKALTQICPGPQREIELENGISIASSTCQYPVDSSWIPLERQFESSIDAGEIILKEYKMYSEEEMNACLDYYKSLQIENPVLPEDDDKLLRYMKLVTQSNPKLVSDRFINCVS